MAGIRPQSKEHYELMEAFERFFGYKNPSRCKDEPYKSKGCVYDNGEINKEFQAFRMGYVYGKLIAEQETA
jgi:hypothetical protein